MFPRRTIVFDISSVVPRNSAFDVHSRNIKKMFIKENINKDIDPKYFVDYYEDVYGSIGVALENEFDISIERYLHYMNGKERYDLLKMNENIVKFVKNNNCILFTNSPRYRAFKILTSIGIHNVPMICMEDLLYHNESVYPNINNMKPSIKAFEIAEKYIKLNVSDFVYFDDNRKNIYAAKTRNWRVAEVPIKL